MPLTLLSPRYDAGVVALSVMIAAYASYVALDLARRVRGPDRPSARAWLVGGGLMMGTGVWSMHFVGMLAFSLPVPLGYDAGITFLSWLAAVGVSLLALSIASRDRLSPGTLILGAAAMGGGICLMHYVGMAAMRMAPGIVWNPWLVAASALIAVVASAAALLIFFGMRRFRGLQARLAQAGAATVMGLAISGMHYTGMAAAGFPEDSLCLSVDGLGGENLGTLVVLATLALLTITLTTSVLDARLQARTAQLTRTLRETHDQLQDANAELQRLSLCDALTGVPNRPLFDDRLGRALARTERAGAAAPAGVAVLLVDLDGFKPINDSFGHAAGDAVLRQVAERLHRLCREVDTLARIGGDEFVLLLEQVAGEGDAEAVAERVVQGLAAPFDLGARQVTLSASVGVAVYPGTGLRDKLVACADAAMHAAKHEGGGRHVAYRAHMQPIDGDQLALVQALRDALRDDALELHYQPKVDARSGCIIGAEALLRWHRGALGWVPPGVFVPLAERYGLIVPLGDWVIDQACRQIARWARSGLRLPVAVNLSAFQLRRHDVVAHIEASLARHGVPPSLLQCEITESTAMEDTLATQRIVGRLRALGVRLSIDDFGTGYSSLASLRQLKAHELKIDRSFVQDVPLDPQARALVEAVVRLAHALGLSVVAEGVETRAQSDALVALGCDELQGFFYARPMPAARLREQALFSGDGAPVRFTPSLLRPAVPA